MARTKQWNEVTVRIEVGDITDMEVEAFLFYAREDLKLDSGFGGAIAGRGGIEIRKELERIGTLAPLQSIITGAGQLKAKYIVHANGPKFQEPDFGEKLEKVIVNALKTAEAKGIRRIALPAMGAGYYGLPAPDSARIMLKTIREYIEQGTELQEIDIVLLDKRQYKPFEEAFLSTS